MAPLDAPAPDKQGLLAHQRIEAFYRQAPFAARTALLMLAVSATVLWERVPRLALLVWMALVLLSLGLRLGMYRSYFRDAQRMERSGLWARRCTWAMLATGAAWGIGAVALYLPEQPLILSFWLIALCGIAASVVVANAFHLPATYAYLLPLLLPMILRLALEASWEYRVIAAGMALFLAFALVQGVHQARVLADSIAMRLENVELVQRLRVEMQAAEAARAVAEEAARAKARFFAAASHDLRQPLHALGLFAAALRQSETSAANHQLIDRLFASIDALESLFNGVLDLARLDADPQPRVVDFALGGLLARIEHQFGVQANQKGLALRVAVSTQTGALQVRCDPVMLERMLGNLLANAIRYTDEGAVMLACRRRAGAVLIQVRDSGFGIAQDEQQRIFEEFYQLGNPERDRAKGLGLGLATVRRMAEAQGLRLGLRSRAGCGSTFWIELPIGEAERPALPGQAVAALEEADGQTLRGKRILVIDDEAPIREGMCELLVAWGCSPIAVDGLVAARTVLQGSAPDAIVADLRLRAGESGIETIAALRCDAGWDLPALLITGDATQQDPGAADGRRPTVLMKPVRPAQLHKALSGLLQPGSGG